MKNSIVKLTAKGGKNLAVNTVFVIGAAQDEEVRIYLDGGQYFVLEDDYKSVAKIVAGIGETVTLHGASSLRPRIMLKSKIMGALDDENAGCSYVYLAGGSQYVKCREDSDYIWASVKGA